MSVQAIGEAIRREEDPRLLKGKGRYVDDVRLPNDVRSRFSRRARYALSAPQLHSSLLRR